MSRPPLEVADVIRAAGPTFLERALSGFDRQRLKALNAIQRCRTAALGGHVDECARCGRRAISYNSCRNRHCPKCQGNARHRWLQARRAELLPTRYIHVVFTLPHDLAPLALVNKKVVYRLLFRLSAETLLTFARDPRWLGAAAPRPFADLLGRCRRHDWVVYAKRPFGGPDHVLQYLGNYIHRIAISNHRLVALADGKVSFRWRDSAHKNKKRVMTLAVEEFLRRFFLHVLPPGFVRIRYFGFLANRQRKHSLPLCRQLLKHAIPDVINAASGRAAQGAAFWTCPLCGGVMVIVERLTPPKLAYARHQRFRQPHVVSRFRPDILRASAWSRFVCPRRAIPNRQTHRAGCPSNFAPSCRAAPTCPSSRNRHSGPAFHHPQRPARN